MTATDDTAADRPAATLAPESAGKLAPPVDWWKLAPQERVETLQLLAEFTSQLVRRYRLSSSVIPPCWYRHESMVQELLAVFQYRNQQQFLEVAPPGAPHEFHYQFQFAMARLRFWVTASGCSGQEHHEAPPQPWAEIDTPASATFDSDFESYVAGLHA